MKEPMSIFHIYSMLTPRATSGIFLHIHPQLGTALQLNSNYGLSCQTFSITLYFVYSDALCIS